MRHDGDSRVDAIVSRFSDHAHAERAATFPQDREAASQAGLYSWWADDGGVDMLSTPFGVRLTPLIYAGQAGATSARSGKERQATLYSRIVGNHLNGNVGSSTFRKTLAAVLRVPLALRLARPGRLETSSNEALSVWIRTQLHVAIAPYPDRLSLAAIEHEVLRRLDPPLNLMRMPPTLVRERLRELRRWLDSPAHPTLDADEALSALGDDVLARIRREVGVGEEIRTLSRSQRNRIIVFNEHGILVETDRSVERGRGPQLVPEWMIRRAWQRLVERGSLTNHELVSELNVKRSAFVCALLARLPEVELVSNRPITLRVVGGLGQE